jgi:hypothetical protein
MGSCTITLQFNSITEQQALNFVADLQAHLAGKGVTITVIYSSNLSGTA